MVGSEAFATTPTTASASALIAASCSVSSFKPNTTTPVLRIAATSPSHNPVLRPRMVPTLLAKYELGGEGMTDPRGNEEKQES